MKYIKSNEIEKAKNNIDKYITLSSIVSYLLQ